MFSIVCLAAKLESAHSCTPPAHMKLGRAAALTAVLQLACLARVTYASEKTGDEASHTVVVAAFAAVCVVAVAGLAVWGLGCVCCKRKPPALPTVPKHKRTAPGLAAKTPDWAAERAVFMSPVNRHAHDRAVKSELAAKGAVEMVAEP